MKAHISSLLVLIALFAMTTLAMPGVMSYQGKLTDADGIGINGDYDLIFRLFDVDEAGVPLWEEEHSAVSVDRGLFSVILGDTEALDLPFNIQYYLEIVVDGDEMTPRQKMTAEAYAFRARTADIAMTVIWDNIDDIPGDIIYEGDDISLFTNDVGYLTAETDPEFNAHVASEITSDDIADWDEAHSWGDHSDEGYLTDVASDGTIDGDGAGTPLFIAQQDATDGQVLKWNDDDDTWQPADDESSNWTLDEIAGTLTTADRYGIFRYGNTGHGDHCSTHVNLGVESITGKDGEHLKYATVGGGFSNKAGGRSSTIAGGFNNETDGQSSTVGGGSSNSAFGTASTISGGSANYSSGIHATISGGNSNIANGELSTVGGGEGNFASAHRTTVSGGSWNTASSGLSTVGGGVSNHASNFYSTISGGGSNIAGGVYSAIPGGLQVVVEGDYSFGYGNDLLVDTDYTAQFYSATNPGILRVVGNLDVSGEYIDSDGNSGLAGQVLSSTVTGTQWLDAPSHWTLDETSGTLTTADRYGIFRYGSTGYGDHCSTHVNLGVESTTGTDGLDRKYATVGGGYQNIASGEISTVCGGYHNAARGLLSTVGGGSDNVANGLRSTVGGGNYNTAGGEVSTVSGGLNNAAEGDYTAIPGGREVAVEGDYSFGFGYDLLVDTDYTAQFYSAAYPGLLRVVGNLDVSGEYIDSDGNSGLAGQVLSSTVTGTQWLDAPSNWILDETAGTLTTADRYGIFRYGSTGYGDHCSTHVNLGVGSTTGEDGEHRKYATVSGGESNVASGDYSAVSGGNLNEASGGWSTVSGGTSNIANSISSTVGGGGGNEASGGWSTVSGGTSNIASSTSSTVGGGGTNVASGGWSTVSGGSLNTASAINSTIPGGVSNTASGDCSFVFGYEANDNNYDHSVVFNWNPDKGTVFINSNGLETTYGLFLPNNVDYGQAIARAWLLHSDEGLKRDIIPIDNSLNIIQELRPVNYNWLSDDTKGIGFIAQEVQQVLPELVSVSNNETGQLGVDYMGIIPVNTAAIQELAKENAELRAEVERLRELEDRLERLEALLLAD